MEDQSESQKHLSDGEQLQQEALETPRSSNCIQEGIPSEFLDSMEGIMTPPQAKLNERHNQSLEKSDEAVKGRLIVTDEEAKAEEIVIKNESVFKEFSQMLIDEASADHFYRAGENLPGDSSPLQRETLSEVSIEPTEENQILEENQELIAAEVEPQDNQPITIETKEQSEVTKSGKCYTFYVFGGNYPETIENALTERGNWVKCKEEQAIEKCNFLWKPFNFGPDAYKRIDKRVTTKSSPFVYNHFEVLKGLTSKSGLVRSLKQYYINNEQARQAGYSTFDTIPTTFLITAGQEDTEWADFNARYNDIQKGFAPKERIPIKHSKTPQKIRK